MTNQAMRKIRVVLYGMLAASVATTFNLPMERRNETAQLRVVPCTGCNDDVLGGICIGIRREDSLNALTGQISAPFRSSLQNSRPKDWKRDMNDFGQTTRRGGPFQVSHGRYLSVFEVRRPGRCVHGSAVIL